MTRQVPDNLPEGISLHYQLPVANALGEGVIWDHRTGHLWWTDILGQQLFHWQFGAQPVSYPCPLPLCSFGLSQDPDWLICAFDRGFAWFNPSTAQLQWLHEIDTQNGHIRLNDGRVDRQGRFWAGSMREHLPNNSALGHLYQLNSQAKLSCHLQQITISNSLCWSPDSRTIYFADSPSQVIQRGRFSPQSGQIEELHNWVHTQQHAYPDGACIDSEGCLWSAQWGAAQVVRYSPAGETLLVIPLPCQQPTCVAFAGPQLNFLCVSSARDGLSHTRQDQGDMYILHTPYQGLEEAICQLPLPDFNQAMHLTNNNENHHGQ